MGPLFMEGQQSRQAVLAGSLVTHGLESTSFPRAALREVRGLL